MIYEICTHKSEKSMVDGVVTGDYTDIVDLCYVVRCFISLYNLILDHGITRILHFQSFHDHHSLRSVSWNHRISSPLPFHRSP